MDNKYKELLEVIPEGIENAISQKELATLLQCDKRIVRANIQDARIHGVPICSTQAGYYLSNDPEEVSECYKVFYQRNRTNLRVLMVIKKHLNSVKKNGGSRV